MTAPDYNIFFIDNPLPMWIYESESLKFLAVNNAALTLYGYRYDDFLSKSVIDIVIEDNKEILDGTDYYEIHKVHSGERLLIKSAKKEILFQDKPAFLSVLTDVSLKARIKSDLLESEKRYSQIVDSAMDAIITVNAAQQIILFNKSAEKMFGYSAETIIGKDLNLLIPSRFTAQHRKHINNFGKTGTTNRKMGTLGTIYGLKSDGTEFPIEASISQVKHENDQLYTVILRDITERFEAEEVKEKFKQLAENLDDVFYIEDAVSEKIIYVSPSFKNIWERDPEDLYNGISKWEDYIHPDDADKIKQKSVDAMKSRTAFVEEFRIITPGGSIKWISTKSSLLLDEAGKIYRITGIATDITERKNNEEELKRIIRAEKDALKTAEASRGKLAYLAEASKILSSSLDYQLTLKTVAQLATPGLSDWCVVDILDEKGELKRLAVSHINPEKIQFAMAIQEKYGPSKDDATGVYNVIRTGRSELYPVIPEELLRENTRDEEHLRLALELGLKSAMIVPLKARGQVFGAITMIYAESDRYYNTADLYFAEDLARRAATAIDNAKLFEQAQVLNEELDRKIKDLELEIGSRKKIEHILIENQEKLIYSEERLKAALNASETGTYRWYKKTNIMDVDEGFLKLFGLPDNSKLTYNNFLEIVHPDDINAFLKEQERSVKENIEYEMEYRIVWSDRTIRWVLDKGRYLSDSQYFTGACVDITYRKHSEQTLRDSEILFRQLAENIRDIFSIMNPENMNIIYVSPVFEDVWGIKREELYRNSNAYLKTVHSDDRERVKSLMTEGMLTGRYSIEFRIIRPDNRIKWLRSRGFPLYNEKGELYRIAGITEDITERKLAEEELHKNQEFLKSTVTSASVILWVVDKEYKITLLEGRGLEKMGIDTVQNKGKHIFSIFGETSEFKQYLEDAFNGNESSYTVQENKSWLEMRVSPLKDHEGNIHGVIGVAVDITLHKESEEKIKASLKEKEVLLKEIHHRVKNNLQIISSILSLQSGYLEDEKIQGIFDESKNRVKSMALLHEKLYQSKDFTKINFKNYIEDLVLNLFSSYQVESDKIRLITKGDNVNIDAEKAISIGLIMNELVSNALKYAFKGAEEGELFISFDKMPDRSLKIILADNGIGLPAGFDLLGTDTLGLKLIHSLVEQLKGRIEVFNYKGARFEILLPEIVQ